MNHTIINETIRDLRSDYSGRGFKGYSEKLSYLWWFRARGKEAKLVKLSEPPLYEGEHVNGKNALQVKRQIEGKGYR